MNLENTSALVTGGASGLGLACAKALVAKGASVVIVDLPTDANLDDAGIAAAIAPAMARPLGLTTANMNQAIGVSEDHVVEEPAIWSAVE